MTQHAFIVLTHGHPYTLERLLEHLQPYPTFVHVDASADLPDFLRQNRLTGGSVFVARSRYCLHWGGFSIVRSMFATLGEALKMSSADQFTFLSGQCFPARRVSEFVAAVDQNERKVYCRATSLSALNTGDMNIRRVTKRHYLDGTIGHLRKSHPVLGGALRRAAAGLPMPSKSLPNDVQIAIGSQWTSVPRALAGELVEAYNMGWFDFLTNSYAPDESAIPTYVYNSRWIHHTQHGALEPLSSPTLAPLANFHYLRQSMQGQVSASDIRAAQAQERYFIRKVDLDRTPALERVLQGSL